MISTNSKRKVEELSKGELDDLKDGTLEDKEDDRIEEMYDEENEENEDETDDESENDSLDGSMKDEFEDGDTSDEEDRRNTIGNVPIEWYDHLPHIGYDLDGKTIAKPVQTKDEIDNFLERCENPEYWKTITDRTTLRDHKLTKEEIEFVKKLAGGEFAAHVDDTPEWEDLYSHEPEIHPINRGPDSKLSFIPSLDERNKVNKLAMLIRRGIIKTKAQREKEREDDNKQKFFDIWERKESLQKSKSAMSREKMAYPAPKLPLPGHAESYRPPEEFLFTEEETLQWDGEHPDDRRTDNKPENYNNLRKVPAYEKFLKERFERCLDLYLAPRQRKMKMNVNKEDLIPKLPSPKDLQPFPTFQAIVYKGHEGMVRSISVHQSGQFLASGGDDGTLRVWEINSGRCLRKLQVSETEKIVKVAWSPNPSLYVLLCAVGDRVLLVNPQVGDRRIIEATNDLIDSFEAPENYKPRITWTDGTSTIPGVKLELKHDSEIRDACWHSKGDYFAVTAGTNAKTTVWFHQLSTRRSNLPFSNQKSVVQKITFHPTRPLFFLATQRYIKIYNLAKQEMQRKLEPNVKECFSISPHRYPTIIARFSMPSAGGLWARVRLQGRRAARWRFQVVLVSGSFKLRGRSAKRPPHRLSLLITRKKRKTRTLPAAWHVTDPTKPTHAQLIIGTHMEPMEFDTTLNSRTTTEEDGFEDKRWSLILEEVTKSGQRKALASTKINIPELLAEEDDDKFFKELTDIELKSYRGRIDDVTVSLHIAGILLKTGQATDDDLQSLASMLSTNTLDIGNLDDFSRKLRPSPLQLSTTVEPVDDDDAVDEEETVGGNAQELLTWARESTKYSTMVNVTNLTSSFRSGIALGVILKHHVPDSIQLAQLNPRMAKNNLRIVLEAYNTAGLDLAGVININETASKPDKLAIITALHLIKNKFAVGKVKRREHKMRSKIDPGSIHSVLFDSKTVWSSLAEFRIETLHEEMRQIDLAPDFYSEAVDDILDAFDDLDDNSDFEQVEEAATPASVRRHEVQKEIDDQIKKKQKEDKYIKELTSNLPPAPVPPPIEPKSQSQESSLVISTPIEEPKPNHIDDIENLINRVNVSNVIFEESKEEVVDKEPIILPTLEVVQKVPEKAETPTIVNIKEQKEVDQSTINIKKSVEKQINSKKSVLEKQPNLQKVEVKIAAQIVPAKPITSKIPVSKVQLESKPEVPQKSTVILPVEPVITKIPVPKIQSKNTPDIPKKSTVTLPEKLVVNKLPTAALIDATKSDTKIDKDKPLPVQELATKKPDVTPEVSLRKPPSVNIVPAADSFRNSLIELLELDEFEKIEEEARKAYAENEFEDTTRPRINSSDNSSDVSADDHLQIQSEDDSEPLHEPVDNLSLADRAANALHEMRHLRLSTVAEDSEDFSSEDELNGLSLIDEDDEDLFTKPSPSLHMARDKAMEIERKALEQTTNTVQSDDVTNELVCRQKREPATIIAEITVDNNSSKTDNDDSDKEFEEMEKLAQQEAEISNTNECISIPDQPPIFLKTEGVMDTESKNPFDDSIANMIEREKPGNTFDDSIENMIENTPEIPNKSTLPEKLIVNKLQGPILPLNDTNSNIKIVKDNPVQEPSKVENVIEPLESLTAHDDSIENMIEITPEIPKKSSIPEKLILTELKTLPVADFLIEKPGFENVIKSFNANDDSIENMIEQDEPDNILDDSIETMIDTEPCFTETVSSETTISAQESADDLERYNNIDRVIQHDDSSGMNLKYSENASFVTVSSLPSDNQLTKFDTFDTDWSSDEDLAKTAIIVEGDFNTPSRIPDLDEMSTNSAIFLLSSEEKERRQLDLEREEVTHKENEQQWMLVLQDLTNKSAKIEIEQEEVDEHAKTVEMDLRNAMSHRNQRKELELTGEWLALVQKRDNQVKEAEIISKQKRRAKLELQLVDIKRNCRALTIKNDYEKSEEDRNHEMTLVKQCIDLVQEKDELENEIGDLEEEIQDQRERHAQQMTQNLLEQEKLRQAEENKSWIKRSWFG